jgi:hypothetical protein
MDPVTAAIIAAVAKVGEQVVLDAYSGLKHLISGRFGDSGVSKRMDDLEAEPESKGRQIVLEEEIVKAGIDKDPAVLEAAEALRALLEKHGGTNIFHFNAGDNAIQFGQVSGGEIHIDRG